jgi:hypothetical protein
VAATIIREDPDGDVSSKQLVFGVPVEVDNSLLLGIHNLHIVAHTAHSSVKYARVTNNMQNKNLLTSTLKMCYKIPTCFGGGHQHHHWMMSYWSVPVFQFYSTFYKLNCANYSFHLLRWPVFTREFPNFKR